MFKKLTLRQIGNINIIAVFPLFYFSLALSLALMVALQKFLYDYPWAHLFSILPMLASPSFSVFCIVHAIKRIKEQHSVRCICCCVIAIIINIAIWAFLYFIGYIGADV